MSLTALIWVAFYLCGLVAAFAHPMFGLLTYLLEYHQRPALNWWGRDLPDFRSNLLAGTVFLLAFLWHRKHLKPVVAYSNPATLWLLALAANTVLVTVFLAVDLEESWKWSTTLQKNVLIYLLIYGMVRSVGSFDTICAAHMIGSASWGVLALSMRRIGGRLESIGSAGSRGANQGGAHLVTVIPILVSYVLSGQDARMRAIAAVCLPLVMNLFILFNSRGALVGLVFSALSAIAIVHWQVRVRIASTALAGGLVLLTLADPSFIERQLSTTNPQDSSAQSRLETWKNGVRLLVDHPFGAGGQGFELLSYKYIPRIVEAHGGQNRAPHNTYLQLASEWGIQGVVLFAGFVAATVWQLHKLRRLCGAAHPLYFRSVAIEVGLLGTLVAANFSDRLYGESILWMGALASGAYRLYLTEQQSTVTATVAAPVAVRPVLQPQLPKMTIRERLSSSSSS